MKRPDVIAEPRRGRAPRNAEPTLVVAFDLAAQPEHEPPIRVRLQIPGLARHNRGAARECYGDRGGELDPFGGENRKGERPEHVMPELDGHYCIKSRSLSSGGERPRIAPMPHRQHRKDAHLDSPARCP